MCWRKGEGCGEKEIGGRLELMKNEKKKKRKTLRTKTKEKEEEEEDGMKEEK